MNKTKSHKINELTVGPIIKGRSNNSIGLWGRGNPFLKRKVFLVARIKNENYSSFSEPIVQEVDPDDDYTGIIEFSNLNFDVKYSYQIGYITTPEFNSTDSLKFTDHLSGSFIIPKDVTSFIFGSCRRYLPVGNLTLFKSGKDADKIYQAIVSRNPDFFLTIGDQFYYDYIPIESLRIKDLSKMRKFNQECFNFPHVKKLTSEVPTYSMCDDHDLHRDNTNPDIRKDDQQSFNNGLKTFKEYQGYTRNSDHLWYTFERDDASFFVLDTRSERTHYKIISDQQMDAFCEWIDSSTHRVRFVVSPVVVASTKVEDSWYGFPEQQEILILNILKKSNTFILSGDVHCCRVAEYAVEKDGYHLGNITEIISSGLSAITNTYGKQFIPNVTDPYEYDYNNHFPYSVNTNLTMTTVYSSPSFPVKNENIIEKLYHLVKYSKPTKFKLFKFVLSNGFQLFRQLFRRCNDGVFTQIKLDDIQFVITIINHKNEELYSRYTNLDGLAANQ